MSDEVILNLSFDNQTVTDLTGNWILDGTPNATYEQIDGRGGYSIVTRSLGRCIVLNAVDQNAVYNEYTVDFDMFVKSTYTPSYYIYKIAYMWSLANPGNYYMCEIGNVLSVILQIGGSEPAGTTDYSPIGRWVHVTITSGPTGVDHEYCTTVYVDGVKLIDRTDIVGSDVNPFALSRQILLFTRDTQAKLMPNGPGICLNTFKVVAGIHVPDQKPAISLLNLRRVFNNFCAWLKGQLSTVALTGSYNDLSDKPTIGTVNDGTLTIQKNGSNVATFTANQSTAATANIVVPTAVSELTNDSGYLTSSSNLDASKLTSGTVDIARLPQGALERLVKVANEAARYALTTAEVQLGDTVQQLDTGVMYVVTDTDHLDSAAGYTEYTAGTAASVPWSGVTGKPAFATVATSGSYNDLSNKPTIPTVNDGTLTIQQNGTTVDTFTANSSSDKTVNITVPTKTSELTNDILIPLSGTNALAGNIVPSTDNAYNLGNSTYGFASIFTWYVQGNNTHRELSLYSSNNTYDPWNHGASISLFTNDYSGDYASDRAGTFSIQAQGLGDNHYNLKGSPNGTLTWGSKNVAMQEDTIPRSGGAVITGSDLGRTDDTGALSLWGGSDHGGGAKIDLFGKDNSTNSGCAFIRTIDANNNICLMTLKPDGTLTWGSKNVAMQEDTIPRSGGNVFSGVDYRRIDNNKFIELYSSSDTSKGGSFGIYSLGDGLYDDLRGAFRLQARDETNIYYLTGDRYGFLEWAGVKIRANADNKCKLGDASHRWTTVYAATGTIDTSDSRLKNTISSIDDNLLDAWESIQAKQYKFNDATESKGEQARFHTGYLAQDIEKACTDNNIDATRYGLFCYDSWEEEPEITEDVEVEKDGIKTTEKRIIRPKREKGNSYALRYGEVLVVECAYLRKKLKELTARIEQLEKGNSSK